MFIDRMVDSISAGKRVDKFIENSDAVAGIAEPYLNGEKDLVAKLSEAIAGLGADGIRDLSVAELLRQISSGTEPGATSGNGHSE